MSDPEPQNHVGGHQSADIGYQRRILRNHTEGIFCIPRLERPSKTYHGSAIC